MFGHPISPRRGFTLVELLAVIAIVGILVSLLIVTVPKIRESTHRATCASNLRELGILVLGYAADHKNQLPRSREGGFFSFVSNILPDTKFGNQANNPMGALIYCPSDESGGVATYSITAGYSGDNTGIYLRNSTVDYVLGRFPLNAYPRPSQTFLLVEAPNVLRTYTLRGDGSIVNPQQQFDSGGTIIHGGTGAHYLYLDGHVAFMNTPMSSGKSPLPTYDQWQLGYKAQ
ncbi:MAG: type II secretion system protein [Opitutaceae bacterium]|jgi:prepilin-type N-terminal cleavage/methylation domain-containing protein/prepilin-type processing-associated H-X9-DG protein